MCVSFIIIIHKGSSTSDACQRCFWLHDNGAGPILIMTWLTPLCDDVRVERERERSCFNISSNAAEVPAESPCVQRRSLARIAHNDHRCSINYLLLPWIQVELLKAGSPAAKVGCQPSRRQQRAANGSKPVRHQFSLKSHLKSYKRLLQTQAACHFKGFILLRHKHETLPITDR